MDIRYLADEPECIPQLAAWFQAQWQCFMPGKTREEIATTIRFRTQRDSLPLAIVAVEDGRVVGTASLKITDMSTLAHLSPWLSSLYVDARCRGRGIGSSLVRAIVEKAARLDFQRLYLFTPDAETFYARLGWRVREHTVYCEQTVAVMSLPLDAARRPRQERP